MKNKLLIVAAICCGILLMSIAASAQEPRCTEDGSIRSVTKARSGSFETVTFEFVGNGLPQSIEVTDVKPPIENYSGKRLRIAGPYYKSISMHMVNWTCRIRENFGARTSTIRGITQTEQFEGYVTYAIGYNSKRKYVGVTKTTGPKTSRVVLKFRR